MAPKKRKSKVSKLSKMDDEERARYLQNKADKEEEARRRKHQLISNFITIKLNKEEVFSKTNTAKLNVIWRQILREVSSKQMKEQIKGMMESLNYLLERKNRLIVNLMKGIEDADEQHRRTFQSHAETINKFLEIAASAMNRLHDDYEERKNMLLEEWDQDQQMIMKNQQYDENHLTLIRFQIKQERDRSRKGHELGLMTVKSDGKIDLRESILELQKSKELEMELYWNQLRQVYTDYVEKHSSILSHYDVLREKDNFYKKEISSNNKSIRKFSKKILKLQSEYSAVSKDLEKSIENDNDEKEFLRIQHSQLKNQIKQNSITDAENFAFMVMTCQTVIEKLEEANTKLNKILHLHKICCKSEEKSGVKYRTYLVQEKPHLDISKNLTKEMIEDVQQMEKLENFRVKVQKAKYDVKKLINEKEKLKRDCEEMKIDLKERLTELALNNGFSNDSNRPKTTNCYHNEKVKKNIWSCRPVTCIEAAHSNAVQHARRAKLFMLKRRENRISAITTWKNYIVSPQWRIK